MAGLFTGAAPYLFVGLIVYLLFRAVIWFLYYKGEMRVPVWHEVGFFLLALYLLLLLSATVSPALTFTIKPSLENINVIPVKGMIAMGKDGGAGAVFTALFRYLPLGFLLPFLFRRYRNPLKTMGLAGGVILFTELIQLFLPAKTDMDDLILGLLGVFLGYMIFGMVCAYFKELGSLATVRRSRRKQVPVLVKRELEILLLVMLLAVTGRGTQLEIVRVKEEKAAQAELERKQEEEQKAAAEAEAQRLAEEEAKKLKAAENMPELSIESEAVCFFSIEDDLILYEKNGMERVAPASTMKLLTALTTLKYCDPEETAVAGEEIKLISEAASTASLKVGTKGTIETFLIALLLPSGNDAAYTLANYTGHKILGDESASMADAVEAFMEAMNAYAEELGLEDSHFAAPDGDVSEGQYTTARDMVRVARASLENDLIREICGKKSARALFENMDVTYQNSNVMLHPSSDYYYAGMIGLKTGSSQEGKCLIGALEVNGKRYVTAVMKGTDEGRWKDTKTLFDEVNTGE